MGFDYDVGGDGGGFDDGVGVDEDVGGYVEGVVGWCVVGVGVGIVEGGGRAEEDVRG